MLWLNRMTYLWNTYVGICFRLPISLSLSMLLQLENTSAAKLKALLAYAQQLNLQLRVIEQEENNVALPGKPLSAEALKSLIESSRNSGTINMKTAHDLIRNKFNAG